MTRRAKRPLSEDAIAAANAEVYNLTEPPGRQLDPNSAADAALRRRWMDAYVAAGGELEGNDPSPPVSPEDPVAPCPLCGKALLTVKVIDDAGNPVDDAIVNVEGIGGNITNTEGYADYGEVEPGTYMITAERRRVACGSGDPAGLATDSVIIQPDETKLVVLQLNSLCIYWLEDHSTDYRGPESKFQTSTQFGVRDVAFRLGANLATGNITITSIFKWGTVASDVTSAQKADTITKFKAQVASWGGKFNMKIIDPICGEKTLPIMFDLLWAPDDTSDTTPFRVNLYKTYPRAGRAGWNVDIGYDSDVTPDSSWVLAHEYGHCFSLPDEYFYSGVTTATLTYKKADGSSDLITLEPSSGNIMYQYGSRTYLKRFYYFAAIEAQELLRRESGRNVTCEIV